MAAVALHFDLPPLQDRVAVIVRPAEIAAWLERLPMLNTAETSRALLERLAQLNRQPVEDDVRLKLIELLREPIHGMCLSLIAAYENLPLPLAGPAKVAADRVQELYGELANGYKRLAMTVSQRVHTTPAQRDVAALCMQRAIHCLARLLGAHYGRYLTPPAGTWHDLHGLYGYAEAEGIADAPVPDPLNPRGTASSVSHVYKQALLLGFADPYHLPPRMIEKVYRYLDAMAPLAQVTRAVPALRADCQFVMDLATDHAGVSDAETHAVTAEARYRFLNTVALAHAMHRQFTALQSGTAPELHGLASDFFAPNGADMLTRLLVAWGVHPKRRFPRMARNQLPVMVYVGLEAICRLANHDLPFERSSNIVGPMPRPPDRPVDSIEAADPANRAASGASWELLDESAGGFSLGRTSAPAQPVHVGDMIGARREGRSGNFDVATVRWVMHTPDGALRIGVQRLAPSAATVGIAPADAPESEFHVVLRLPAIAALQQPETLITPRGVFRPDRALVLDDGSRTHRIVATRLVNITGAFEHFQFRFGGT